MYSNWKNGISTTATNSLTTARHQMAGAEAWHSASHQWVTLISHHPYQAAAAITAASRYHHALYPCLPPMWGNQSLPEGIPSPKTTEASLSTPS